LGRPGCPVYRVVGGASGASGIAGMQIELPGRRAWPGGHCTPGVGSDIPGVELPGRPGVVVARGRCLRHRRPGQDQAGCRYREGCFLGH